MLVHGLGARGEDWAAMMPGLAAARISCLCAGPAGVWAVAAAGCELLDLGLEEADGGAFMQAVHVPRADVGGWSMGGWIAMKLTLDHPEMVDRLVVYDSAGRYFPASDDAGVVYADGYGRRAAPDAVLSPRPVNLPEFVARDVLRKVKRMRG